MEVKRTQWQQQQQRFCPFFEVQPDQLEQEVLAPAAVVPAAAMASSATLYTSSASFVNSINPLGGALSEGTRSPWSPNRQRSRLDPESRTIPLPAPPGMASHRKKWPPTPPVVYGWQQNTNSKPAGSPLETLLLLETAWNHKNTDFGQKRPRHPVKVTLGTPE